jgi:hypothetical protein
MALTKRITKGSPLTFLEGDDNLDYLYSLSTNTGSFVVSSQTSSFVVSSQTSSFVVSSQTSSFVVSSQTGSFIVNGQSESFKFTGSLNFTGSVDITGSTKANSVLLNGGGLASNWIYPINIENINWRDPAVLTSDRPGFTHFYPSNTNFGVGSDNDFTYYFGDVNFGHRMKSSVAGVLKFSRDFSAVPDTKMYTLVSDGSNVSDNNTSIFGYNNFNGKTHILTVSGSFRSVDNTSLGSNINNTHHITGSTFISGSIAQIGSLSIGGSIVVTGSLSFQSSTGSTIFLPNISGSFTTSSLSNLTGSGVPFLHVINGELWFYNGSIFEKLNS